MVECAPGNDGVQMMVGVTKLERRIVRYCNKYIVAGPFIFTTGGNL